MCAYTVSEREKIIRPLTIIVLWEGGWGRIGQMTQNLLKSARIRKNNNTALIKQISLFDAALGMTNTNR